MNQREALLELAKRRKMEKYRYFEPTGKGEEFIREVASGKHLISALSAANGIGKTTLSINMLAHLFWPCGSQYFNHGIWEKWPHLKKGRIVSDPTTVKEALIPEIRKWFPEGRYSVDKGGKSFDSHFRTDTGWEFDIMTFEQDPKEFESANLGFVWLDEPPPYDIYKACISRLRRGGILWTTFTPLTGSAWIYDELIANDGNEKAHRFWMEADVWSAVKDVGIRGFLEKEHVERMIAQYNDDDKQARVFGKFQHLTGLVFKRFDRKVHVIKPFQVTFDDHCVYQFLDPHPRTPDAALWCMMDRNGTLFVIDEFFEKVDSDAELAQRIKAKDSQYRVMGHYIDPSAFNVNQHDASAKSLADKLAGWCLDYQPATKKRTEADRAIRDALDYRMVADRMLMPPKVFIFDTCQRLIWELEHYKWQEWTGKARDSHGPRETPVDKDDHQIENMGRFLHMRLPYLEPREQETALGRLMTKWKEKADIGPDSLNSFYRR